MSRTELSADEARRIALAAQGFADPRPDGRVDVRHLRRVFDRVGIVQIDSVNVLTRAHYLALFARLGPYRPELLDEMTYRRRELFEQWAHAACFVPVDFHPLLRHRQQEWPARNERHVAVFRQRYPGYLEAVLEEVRERGPVTAGELDDPGERGGPWWGWARGKTALEWHWRSGRLAVADRRNFERVYDLAERVLPPEVVQAETLGVEDARRELVRRSVRSLGVATSTEIADYYRVPVLDTRARIRELVDAGELLPVSVEGWGERAYLDPGARLPRRVEARALLTAFDSLIWAGGNVKRGRADRLFDFRYVLEIYVPEAKREHGYYVLPFLLGERLVARVDLKADRATSALLVRAAYLEPGAHEAETAGALAEELREMADWLALERVGVKPRGDLAPALGRAVG